MDILTANQGDSALILSMPHSGIMLPPALSRVLVETAHRFPDTDWHIPRLYEFANDLNVTVVRANYSRYVIDLNRSRNNMSLYPGRHTTELCPLSQFDGSSLYHEGEEPDVQEIERRARQYWDPYHAELANQIKRVHSLHGYAVVYDCHSIRSRVNNLFEGRLPDLNLGTANSRSCAAEIEERVVKLLESSDFTYAVNGRFTGGHITRHYGAPEQNIHAMQMEIAQCTYMAEDDSNAYLEDLAGQLQKVLFDIIQSLLRWKPGQVSLV